MFKILMTYKNTEGMEALLDNPEFAVDIRPKPTPEEFREMIGDYDGLMIRSEVKVTKEIVEAGKKLKFVGRAGTGVDNVDIPAATQKGIVVANVPGGNTISAAEHTVGLMLALARNIPDAHASLKTKEWKRERFIGNELLGKTLGLVGFGRIGREVAHRMLAFGMRVVAFDPFASAEFMQSLGIESVSLDRVYAEADYISIHSPLNDTTRNMINAESIGKMKQGVRIVNCARGNIIDEKALSDALKSGKVGGAAVDVFAKEPPVDWTLIETEHTVVTPHLAASTEEAQVKIAQELSGVVVDFFAKGVIRNAVNVPTLDWDTYKKIEPYISLAEKIGSFQGQVVEGGIREIEVEYRGAVAAYNSNPFLVAYLKGLLTPMLDIKVNFVNAPVLARERGVKIRETKVQEDENYTALLTVKVRTDSEEFSVSGTIFGNRNPRIVRVDGLSLDVVLEGCMIMLTNADRPGMVGLVGSVLGRNSINIAGMQVGRREQGASAITVINIDTCASADALSQIRALDGVSRVKSIVL